MKNKIAFLAPQTKGGPYFVYKDLAEGLKEKYQKELDVYFFNSKSDWLKLHFLKFDFVFSVIPFLFKPIGAKKFIFNPRGNFEIEKKKNNLGNKLLYLAKNNLKFADKIMLTSYFLADKLDFRKKFQDKIFILPNFIDLKGKKLNIKKIKNTKIINFLTVSSTKFLEKGMGIVDIGQHIANIKDLKINWTIIAGGNKENKILIKKKFNSINFSNNININWIDWVEKEKLENYYKNVDIFVYGTRLETWGQTILEAMIYGNPVILLDYELWKYIYPEEIITNNISGNLKEVLNNYEKYSQLSIDFIKKHNKKFILEKIIKIVNE